MITELELRKYLLRKVIEILEKETNDPRQPEALAVYRAQLAELEIINQKPEPIVIHIKPGRIFSEAPKTGG